MKLEELREHVNKLKALLDDPQEGLISWNEFLYKDLKALSLYGECKDCKFWDEHKIKHNPFIDNSEFRICRFSNSKYDTAWSNKTMFVGISPSRGDEACVATKPDFGCVMFKKREDQNENQTN